MNNLKKRIAEGLSGWLTFEFKCERGYLFSEYYLAHALGQLLRAEGSSVRAEEPHPTLAVPGAVGRPPSIDFVAQDQAGQPILAVETKWAGFSDVTANALIWDAFHLEAFHRQTGAPGLLILGGTKSKLQSFFKSAAFIRTTPAAVPLLPLPNQPRRLVLERAHLPATVRGHIDAKAANYAQGVIANRLMCKDPKYHNPAGSPGLTFSVYVWEILSQA